MKLTDELRIFERVYLSISHIVTAAYFARTSTALEGDESKIFLGSGKFSEDWVHEHRAHVTASILSSTAFLEATINEIYADACQDVPELQPALDSASLRSLTEKWTVIRAGRRESTLEKYQSALEAARRERFNQGEAPFQLIKSIMNLRNALVHHVPETRESALGADSVLASMNDLEKALRGKFPPSPLYRNSTAPFFPNRCLSSGCARWVVVTCVSFTDEFFSRMGLPPTYEHVRSGLNTSAFST